MQTLNFFICDQVIEAQCPGRLVVAQTRGHLFAQFALDQEWEGLNVTAVFSNDFARKSYQRILTADPVEVPKEVLAPGRLFVSLVGLGDGGAVRLTTKRMDKPIIVYRAGDLIGLTPEETTPDLWEQAMSAIGRLDELQTSDKSSVVAAINAVLQSGGGGSVDPDAIAQAVADYMAAHPIQETDPTVPAWAKQPQKPTYTAAEVGALPDTYTPPVDDALSETSANPVQNKVVAGKLSEIEAIAKGRATGYVFDTESDMRAWIASNASELNIGDNLYIRATDVPDYWWDGTAAQPLETQKVDLTEYAKKSEVPAVDTTLTQSGQAADAAEVGARLSSLSDEIANIPSGTDDYVALSNKPKINGVELSGDKTSADLKIGTPSDEQVSTAVSAWLVEHPEATTTVEDGSITEQKLADRAVSEVKSGFLVFDGNSANLFNKATATDGKRCESSWVGDADGYSASDFIPVEENTVYCRSANTFDTYRYTLCYDADKTFITGIRHYSETKIFTTPAGCAYVRIDMPTTAKDTAMLVIGDSEPSEYIPYLVYYKFGENIRIAVDGVADIAKIWNSIPDGVVSKKNMDASVQQSLDGLASVDEKVKIAATWNDFSQRRKEYSGRVCTLEKTVKGVMKFTSDISANTITVCGTNLFNVNDMEWFEEKKAELSHAIAVEPGKTLYFSRDVSATKCYMVFRYYDESMVFLSSDESQQRAYYGKITIPENAYYMKVRIAILNDGASLETDKLVLSTVDIGTTAFGYGAENGSYFGKTLYHPYVGYRIENGVFIGSSDAFTVEEVMHIYADSEFTVNIPVEDEFDPAKLRNVVLKYGRSGGSDYVMARIFKTTIDGNTILPHVVTFSPGGKTAAILAKENNFVMAINAGVFNTDDSSCVGNTISNGEVISDHVASNTFYGSDTLAIDSAGNLSSYEYTTEIADMIAAGVVHAVQGKGTLIVDYAIADMGKYSEKLNNTANAEEKHPRTVIGQYGNGDYMVFVCGGRKTNDAGMTMHEINDILVADGVKYAYNLDGGGSCNMRYHKKELAPYTEGRSLPSYIVFG